MRLFPLTDDPRSSHDFKRGSLSSIPPLEMEPSEHAMLGFKNAEVEIADPDMDFSQKVKFYLLS